MNEKPSVARKPDGGLQLNESAKARLTAFAEQHHENPKHVLAEVERGLPLGRLFLRVLEIEVPEVRNGRLADDATFKARYSAISKAVAQFDVNDAKGIAGAIRATARQLGISVPTARTIFYGRAGKGGKHEGGPGRAYWQPLADIQDPEADTASTEPLFKDG